MSQGTRRGFLTLLATAPVFAGRTAGRDHRLRDSFRRPEKNGWIYIHLEGEPHEIGFQHGYHLASMATTSPGRSLPPTTPSPSS